jgi:hypothetical protein
MKVVLAVLILGFFINLTSAFLWRSNEQKTTPASMHRSIFLQQRKQLHNGTHPFRQPVIAFNKNNTKYWSLQRVVNRRRYPIRNTTAIQRQADTIHKNTSRIIPRNRFRAIAYQQQQHRALNNPSVYRQANRTLNNTNKQIIHSRFRYILPKNKTNATSFNRRAFLAALFSRSDMIHSKSNGSSIAKNKIQRFSPRLLHGKTVVTSTKTSFLRALTTKATNNNENLPQQRSLADYYYQEQFKTYIRHLNEQNAAHNRALKKQWGQSDIIQPDAVYPMDFVHADPLY